MANLSVAEVQDLIGKPVQLIDVRESNEVADGMVPGARHIPLGEIPVRYGEIRNEGQIVMICRSGNRSGKAVALLQQAGYEVDNMDGGMLAWQESGYPVQLP